MKSFITLIFLFVITNGFVLSQSDFSKILYENYSKYRSADFEKKNFTQEHLKESIDKIKSKNIFNIQVAGQSLEGREIYLLSIGSGETHVLLWSQMHGDESTATMALMDVFNFLSDNDEFNSFREKLFNNLKIYFIPMLNPDGAERFRRRNALDIDINRDARRLQFPESQILKAVHDSVKPKFGFNLHDQNTRYSVGRSFRSATISFLAPAFNYQKDLNEVRTNTMKLIVNIYNVLNQFIPGHIARYKDDFEPRAFGDNFVKWGTSSVLIESGGWKNDTEKQFIRKLNFIAILSALYSIAEKSYEKSNIKVYEEIPFNDNLIFDVLLRNLTITYSEKKYTIDVGINKEETYTKNNSKNYFDSKIEDWGDLSIFYGYDELDLDGYEIKKSKIYNLSDTNLTNLDLDSLITNGYGFVRLNDIPINWEFSPIPLNIVKIGNTVDLTPGYHKSANFTIWKNGKLFYNIINGFIYNIEAHTKPISNGIIFH